MTDRQTLIAHARMSGETLAYVEADCHKCGGSGGVVVEATP